MRRLIHGYDAASDLTGLPARTLKKMVAKRLLRVHKPLRGLIYFDPMELEEDITATKQPKRR